MIHHRYYLDNARNNIYIFIENQEISCSYFIIAIIQSPYKEIVFLYRKIQQYPTGNLGFKVIKPEPSLIRWGWCSWKEQSGPLKYSLCFNLFYPVQP